MKKYTILSTLAILGLTGALSSCSSDPEYDDTEVINLAGANLSYNDGVWEDNDGTGFLTVDGYEFSHYSGDIIYGFTPSKVADTSLHTPLYTFPYASASGGGVSGAGSPYLVGYWAEWMEPEGCEFDERTCRIYQQSGNQFKPVSVMVCNNTYLMYELLNGSDFMPEITPGSQVKLIAHGVHLDGSEDTATYDLVNIESTDIKSGILTTWQEFDLSTLGACTGIYFTMDCSENLKNQYGMLVPQYFCLDKLTLKE